MYIECLSCMMATNKAAITLRPIFQINRFSLGPYPKSDGDQTRILHDRDGSLLGYTDTYIMNKNNWLTRHIGCMENWDCKCVICKGKYGSVRSVHGSFGISQYNYFSNYVMIFK